MFRSLFGRGGAGKFGEQFVSTRQPRTHGQIAADVRKRILERVSVPKTDAVAILQTIDRFRRERLHVGSQQVEVMFVKTRRQNAHLRIAETEVFRLDQVRDFGDPRRVWFSSEESPSRSSQQLQRGAVGRNVARVDSQLQIARHRLFQQHARDRRPISSTLTNDERDVARVRNSQSTPDA